MKPTVYVYDLTGTPHAHGPARASEAQANSVAASLRRRLGWHTVVATAPPPVLAPAPGPTATEASCSPVWKIPALAAQWETGKRSRAVTAPVATPVTDTESPSGERSAELAVADRLRAAGLVLA